MKKPWLAVVLSFLYPGLGHLYLGRTVQGLVLIVLEFLSILCMSIVIGLFTFPVIWLYAMIDAFKKANEANENASYAR